MKIKIIEQKEVLTKFHNGLTNLEVQSILSHLANDKCVYLETFEDGRTIKTWYFYPKKGGQIMSGTNFNNFKNNSYEPQY